MAAKLTTQEFIEKAKIVHGDRYDYSLAEYINSYTKVKIICKEHGVFEQRIDHHINGHGCAKCVNNKKLTTQEFIEKSLLVHGNKYNYSLVEYINNQIEVKIICPIHGVFKQKPNKHLLGHSCQKCSGKFIYSKEEFINRANETHNNIYDYSLVKYKGNHFKVKIICSIHGVFEQYVNNHLQGKGCQKCSGNYLYNKEEFIEKAKITHDNKYNYSLVEYINRDEKISIICPEHGEFKQRPATHYKSGCPKCNESKGEREIRKLLKEWNIQFESQKTFDDCRNIKQLPFDFYLPEKNILIEYDGRQHFEAIDVWGGEEALRCIQKNDEIKTKYCLENKIQLIRIRYDKNVIDELIKIWNGEI